jgi:NADPH:quinone reductase-like Zn-dependent oxidoreductase
MIGWRKSDSENWSYEHLRDSLDRTENPGVSGSILSLPTSSSLVGIDGVAGKAATIAGVLSQSGTLVVYALMSGEPVTIAPLDLIAKGVVVKGFFLNHPGVELKIPGALRETAPLVASGAIRVPIAATYPLTAFREAVAHDQRGRKVMFDVDGASESRSE